MKATQRIAALLFALALGLQAVAGAPARCGLPRSWCVSSTPLLSGPPPTRREKERRATDALCRDCARSATHSHLPPISRMRYNQAGRERCPCAVCDEPMLAPRQEFVPWNVVTPNQLVQCIDRRCKADCRITESGSPGLVSPRAGKAE